MDKIKIKSLGDVNNHLTSSDYKERMIGEALELGLRIHKLEAMLDKTPEERGFEFTTPRHLLEAQLETMRTYYRILGIRANLENVDLPEVDYE